MPRVCGVGCPPTVACVRVRPSACVREGVQVALITASSEVGGIPVSSDPAVPVWDTVGCRGAASLFSCSLP
eukprot:14995952-Alexandrium_andersonii.AAC.1